MSKLPKQYQFVDLSDYGRFIARRIATSLKNTSVTPIQVTSWFIISGLIATVCIIYKLHIAAAFFLILKSILDAADGELSRIKNMPSYTGRYFDSIADILLNFLFLLAFWYVSDEWFVYMILAFIGMQLQGTLYNYYYVILRNSVNGDTTSRVIEDSPPKAMEGEEQSTVDYFFKVFNFLYVGFDRTIHFIDKKATESKPFPKWFMTSVSIFGLGFQLLLMSVMLLLDLERFVIPFYIFYSILIFLFVGIRRLVLN
ncbi:CDP-alcohol phosphatidyltransferase family protein [Portibacter lacus]|uniref:CDP-alcohol phosphatidyltransferase n=1 Tax=Portibacter lacus TaxID=1099794 RepID=A0AA37SUE0_9BACT|nr:CDP-alcohol phosphatidyltransferase family protein [Portibacter lacus]GLR19869.1 CDP-alcohol phosphatidyltransferase [Portibacter lacus]